MSITAVPITKLFAWGEVDSSVSRNYQHGVHTNRDLKQFMIFVKTGLQGLPTRVTLPLPGRAIQLRLSKGATGSPYSQHGTLWQARGGPQYLETFRAGADPGTIFSAFLAQLVGRLGSEGFWDRDYGWAVSRPFGAR